MLERATSIGLASSWKEEVQLEAMTAMAVVFQPHCQSPVGLQPWAPRQSMAPETDSVQPQAEVFLDGHGIWSSDKRTVCLGQEHVLF